MCATMSVALLYLEQEVRNDEVEGRQLAQALALWHDQGMSHGLVIADS